MSTPATSTQRSQLFDLGGLGLKAAILVGAGRGKGVNAGACEADEADGVDGVDGADINGGAGAAMIGSGTHAGFTKGDTTC